MKYAVSILKKYKSIFLIFILFLILAFNTTKELSTLSQVEEVTIGEQIWMKRNLNVDRFQNGDLIPEAKTKKEWQKANESKQPAWCYYDNNSADADKKGRLYNWYAVSDQRGLAPAGWRIPTIEEWDILLNRQMERNKRCAFLQNDTLFAAVLVGVRYGSENLKYKQNEFVHGNVEAYWWTSTWSLDEAHAVFTESKWGHVYKSKLHQSRGLSVRCIK